MFGNKNNKKSGMNIIIVGCGKVGSALVERLAGEGHNITLIDKDAAKIQAVTNMYDVMGLVGNGGSYGVQVEAGIDTADLFIAVTDSDELNLLCCTVAKREGKCVTIARVHTPEYSKEAGFLKEKLGLEMIINPEYEAAKVMSRTLSLPMAEEVSSFAHGQVEMIKIRIPEGNTLDGMKIKDLGRDVTTNVVICAVEREGEVFIPSGMFILRAGDLISFVATRKDARGFLKKIGLKTGQIRDALIVGGGKDAYYLAEQLIRAGIEVSIIERNADKCEALSIMLPKAVIINDDGTNEEVLKEAGLHNIQAFIPLTGIDEENIILSLYAKRMSEAKVITRVSRNNFKSIVNTMDLGSVIFPKYVISDAIVAYVRARMNSMDCNIETLYHIFGSRAEAIEFMVENESAVTGKKLSDMKFKNNLRIAYIRRKNNIIFPGGDDEIHVGDSVMVVTTNTGFQDIQDILA
ncbi:MAG: Trk system potassium transporter TrkA [Lachnospiraceae bacterium]|nr:Trk system potassium transporter TrkA [Lachnospiraceae bacterium]